MATALHAEPGHAFRHEALFYAGEREFVDGTVAFVSEGLEADEAVLVVVPQPKIDLLRSALGPDAAEVSFADMAGVGRNPARIIPAWEQFVAEQAAAGRSFRGVGEPVGPSRTEAELLECHRHESLLNVAFGDGSPWWLLCPYDTEALDPEVVAEARRTHPFIQEGSTRDGSTDFRYFDVDAPFGEALPQPPANAAVFPFGSASLRDVRRVISDLAAAIGLGPDQEADLVIAVNEIATNSLRHGGGDGTLRVWQEGDTLICEVCDRGHITEPLIGRRRPPLDRPNGRGLWLANQLCDLVQLQSSPAGTAVRLHMRRDGAGCANGVRSRPA